MERSGWRRVAAACERPSARTSARSPSRPGSPTGRPVLSRRSRRGRVRHASRPSSSIAQQGPQMYWTARSGLQAVPIGGGVTSDSARRPYRPCHPLRNRPPWVLVRPGVFVTQCARSVVVASASVTRFCWLKGGAAPHRLLVGDARDPCLAGRRPPSAWARREAPGDGPGARDLLRRGLLGRRGRGLLLSG
jgi:hypothetical protein